MDADAPAWARCDDVPAGRAWCFPHASEPLVATRPDQVADVLDAVDAATRAGSWAFGFVTYEAGTALLDPSRALAQVPDLPLVWFGISAQPVAVDLVSPRPAGSYATGSWTPRWDEETYVAAVEAIRQRIAAGDVYQANLTSRWSATATGDSLALYADLIGRQRGAYGMYVDTGRFAIASASPELFVDVRGDHITMRPMKGTAPRGRDRAGDLRIANALRTSAKERAENVMIVDLVRNDLARVARTGSVRVRSLLDVERFETVHQLTSEVVATATPDLPLAALFAALFPSGSVTGAPKRSAMQILDALEGSPRGVYCGAVGYLAPRTEAPRARFNVAIRTVTWDRHTATATYGSGGGITWGSEPLAEYREALVKTAVLEGRPVEFALLETMRGLPDGGVYLLARHLRRLADSAAYFGFSLDEPLVRKAILDAAAQAPTSLLRLTLDRDGTVAVTSAPLPQPSAKVLDLRVEHEPVDAASVWLRHKTTVRADYERRRARHPDVDEVVLVNRAGEVTEAATANIVARSNGVWCTPPVESGCLPGVERAELLAAGTLVERRLTPADLDAADELALVNALRGRRAARLVHRTPPAY